MTIQTAFGMIVTLIGLSSPAMALLGGMEGGGGKSVVCRNPDGSIKSAEILDLYEGRTIYQLPYKESAKNWQDQAEDIFVASGIELGISHPPMGIYTWFHNAITHLVFLPDGTSLKPIDDSLEVIIPKGCALEQTVNYQNDHRILIDGSIWKALSETQRAALIIHEATYRELRRVGETDSRRARHFTAHIVAGQKIESTFPGNNYSIICSSGPPAYEMSFYLVKDPTPGSFKVQLYFSRFGGRYLMSRSVVEITHNIDILRELRHPTGWIQFTGFQLKSLFEDGDVFNLFLSVDKDGKEIRQLSGISALDGSNIAPVDITCR
jgi:hypothetical protein